MNKPAHTRNNRRLADAAACAVALPLVMSAFTGAGATIGDPGDDPKVVLPPACSAASIMATYGMSGNGVTERVVPGIKVPAGNVTVIQLVDYDAYKGRHAAEPQSGEQVSR